MEARKSLGRRVTPYALVILWLACASVIAWIQLTESIEGNFRALVTIASVLLTIIAMGMWTLLFSGLPLARRVIIVGKGIFVIILIIVAGRLLLRREGSFTGSGMPRFVWKWIPHPVVAPLQAVAAKAPIDLRATTPDDSPRFLGPQGDGQIRDVHLSRDWSARPPQLLWRREMGLGWSSFSVVGKYAITMEQRSEQECTICYDIATGAPLWVHSDNASLIEREGGDGPRATPTIEDGRVYALGGVGNLNCLDGATGKTIWSHTILTDPPAEHLRYGQTASPAIVDAMVIVTGGQAADGGQTFKPALLAFDKMTGKPLWQYVGDQPGYATPTLATLAGVRQLIVVHQHSIAGHDITDGHLLWEHSWPGFWPKASNAMAVGGDRVYCSTGYGIGSVLLQIATDGKNLKCYEIWRNPLMKTELSNVIVRDNCVYGLDDRYLTCQDLQTGTRKWRQGRYGHGQILQAGDLMLVQTEEGDVVLVDANPTGATELGRIEKAVTGNTCWNMPALAGHLLLVRNEREAACYRLP